MFFGPLQIIFASCSIILITFKYAFPPNFVSSILYWFLNRLIIKQLFIRCLYFSINFKKDIHFIFKYIISFILTSWGWQFKRTFTYRLFKSIKVSDRCVPFSWEVPFLIIFVILLFNDSIRHTCISFTCTNNPNCLCVCSFTLLFPVGVCMGCCL